VKRERFGVARQFRASQKRGYNVRVEHEITPTFDHPAWISSRSRWTLINRAPADDSDWIVVHD
jgi:hypothetical protein